MDYLDELYQRFTTSDPTLTAALAEADPSTSLLVSRFLRHTPLHRLVRSRGPLVAALLAVPQLHGPLRSAWSRQDPVLTARVFAWVERARRARERTADESSAAMGWTHEGELAAA